MNCIFGLDSSPASAVALTRCHLAVITALLHCTCNCKDRDHCLVFKPAAAVTSCFQPQSHHFVVSTSAAPLLCPLPTAQEHPTKEALAAAIKRRMASGRSSKKASRLKRIILQERLDKAAQQAEAQAAALRSAVMNIGDSASLVLQQLQVCHLSAAGS